MFSWGLDSKAVRILCRSRIACDVVLAVAVVDSLAGDDRNFYSVTDRISFPSVSAAVCTELSPCGVCVRSTRVDMDVTNFIDLCFGARVDVWRDPINAAALL